jgi:hypothetical protein
MTRDDLEELHALAASISDDRRGWRAHRREKAEAAARRRLQAEMLKPIKRRRQHRWVAGAVVALLVSAGVVLIVIHLPGRSAPAPKRTILQVNHLSAAERAGQNAAVHLVQLGQPPNVFACQQLYDTQHMGSVFGQQGQAWHDDYLNACINAPVPGGPH